MPVLRRLASLLRALSARLAGLELFLCQVLIVAFALLLLANVTMRYVFDSPIYFAEELAVYILIWMAFLAIAATIARREMIALTFAIDAAPPRLRRAARIAVEIMVLGIVATLALVSWRWLNSPVMAFERALTLGTVKWPFYAIVPIFFTLASLHTLANLLALVVPEAEPGGKTGDRAR